MRWERIGDELVVLDPEAGVVHRVPSEAVDVTESALAAGETSRRRMLALLAGGSIAGVTTLALPSVAAAASGGVGGSGVTDTTVPAMAPAAPATLTASNETNTTVKLTWSAVTGASSYVLLSRAGATGSFTVVQSNIAGLTHTATGLTRNSLYNFVVRAVKSGLESVDSSIASASTTDNDSLSTPDAPSVTLDESDLTKLTVTWSAVAGATSYELWRAVGDGTEATKLLDPATSPVAQSGLSVNTRYRYAVKAKNPDFTSDISDEGSLLTPPSTPSTPTFGTSTDTTVLVEWAVVTGATSYEVFARTGTDAFTSRGVTNSPSLVVGSLLASTVYDFRVTAINTGGSSLPSNSASRTTAPAAPGAPSLGSVTASSMTVSWSAVTAATTYQVFYGTSASDITTSAGSTSGTSLSLSGLTAGTTYWFVVTSGNGTDVSAPSSSTSTRTIPAAPSTPTFGTVTATSVQVQWSAVTGAAASGTGGYEVFYGTSSSSITTSGGTTYGTSLTVSGLSSGTTYWFTVKAGNASGWSAASSSASKLLLPAAPSAPTLSNHSTTSVRVTWSNVTGATGYEVLYKASGAGSFTSFGTGLTSPVTVTGLTAGTTYEFAVVASNGSGSSQSSSTSAPTLPSAPSTPTFGTVTATSVQVQWSAVTGAAASGTGGYEVFYGTSSSSITTSGGATFGTSLTISGLSSGTTYWFTVKAGNASGWSAASTSASKITLPTQVGTVTPTAAGDNVALSWSAVTSATGYTVEYKTSSASAWASFGTVNTNSATVTGLVELTAYDFRVSATNASGTGAVSSTASATTLQYATGGTTTTYTSGGVTYRVHTFNSSGTFTLNSSRTVDYLILGGGGGGGGGGYVNNLPAGGGAGGAGGVARTGSNVSMTAGAKAVTVGAGGSGGAGSNGAAWNGTTGSRGGSSSFNSVTATGGWGGLGGGWNLNGTWSDSFAGEWGGANDDFSGGYRYGYGAGGGAGAGTAGGGAYYLYGWTANSIGGNGGTGIASSITGTATTYGGGGGGGTRHPGSDPWVYYDGSRTDRDGGWGGSGGGGAGASGYLGRDNGGNGTANLGGGGGGGRAHGTWTYPTAGNGGNGGAGVVIIRYAI